MSFRTVRRRAAS